MEIFDNFNLWAFITLNPWSSFFTLIFVGYLLKCIFYPALIFRTKFLAGIMLLLSVGLVSFSLEIAEFVDIYPFAYWIIMYLAAKLIGSLAFRRSSSRRKGSSKKGKLIDSLGVD